MRWSVALGGVVTACASEGPAPLAWRPAPAIVAPQAETPLPPPPSPVTFVPADRAVEQYSDAMSPDVTLEPSDDELAAASHAVVDPRLCRAANQLAPLLDGGHPIDADIVGFVFAWNGIVEPPVAPVIVRGDRDAVIAALGTLPVHAHLGIAHRGDATLVVVTDPAIAFAPFPKRITGASMTITGKLDARYEDLGLQINGDKHVHADVVPKRRGRSFTAELPCQGRTGPADVRILGIGKASATVIAKFPVWCNSDPPLSLQIDPLHDVRGDGDPVKAAHRLFDLLQRDRAAAGVRVLAWNDAAAASAREHADQLAASDTGDRSKLAAVSLPAAHVVENVAFGSSVDGAYVELMSADARRATALADEYTSGAIGVASAKGHVFVSQIFVSTPRTVDTVAAARDLERRMVASSKLLDIDPELSRIAGMLADARTRGIKEADVERMLADYTPDSGYTKLWFTTTTTTDLSTMQGRQLDIVPKVDHVGIAVIQGHDPKLGDKAFSIIIVAGKKRDNY